MSDETENPWARVVGPCYTAEAIQRVLGIDRTERERATTELHLLTLTTSDNVVLYPAFQVDQGRLVDGLTAVLAVLRSGIDDPWTWAQWLNTVPVEGDDTRRRIDALRDGAL
ncbi:MAG: hypothetical protein FJW64_07260, partial [Actinobacteria bacterium]|nr:hypothetical protein [Actinomycetota bacterium]